MDFITAIKSFNEWRQLKVKRIDGYDLDLRQFCIFIKNKDIEDVNIQDITSWLNWYRKLSFENWTVIKKAMALRKFFEYYGRLKYDVIDYWLIPIPVKTYHEPKVCTESSFNALLRATKGEIRNRTIISLCWDTGVRICEISALNCSDIDRERKVINVRTAKTRGMRPFRQLPYSNYTDYNLGKWLKYRKKMRPPDDALFVGIRTKGRVGVVRLKSKTIGEIFKKLSLKAGIPTVNPHSLRHHFGTELAKQGFNNSLISESMGHAQLNSSFIYTQINNNDLSEMLRKRLDNRSG